MRDMVQLNRNEKEKVQSWLRENGRVCFIAGQRGLFCFAGGSISVSKDSLYDFASAREKNQRRILAAVSSDTRPLLLL